MKFAKKTGTMGLAILAALATVNSSAAFAAEPGWYGGLNIGQTRSKIDEAKIMSNLLANGLATTAISSDNRDTGFKVFGGYQFNRYLALEGGYFDLGQFSFTANTLPLGSLSGNIKLQGMNLDVVGTLPLTERFSAFARVGANAAKAKDTFGGTGLVIVSNRNPSKRETNMKFGGGLQYQFSDALTMRAEVERYRVNDAVGSRGDVDMTSIGLVYQFGGKRPIAYVPARTPEPAYVPAPAPAMVTPPAPTPAPVVQPPPRQPQRTKVTLSADSLFGFDKITLSQTGLDDINKFTSDLRSVNYDVITVTGHTDRLGSQEYNQKLSMRRAEAVKSRLLDAGIPVNKISTEGKGEDNPITKPDDCKGAKATKALIACLQPDRRVEIEVVGSK
jgi:OmpA-OmpF porin, OOP family